MAGYRPAFLDQKPPPGYIAGVGRGAFGFATRGQKNETPRVPKRYTKESNDEDDEDVFASIEEKRARKRAPKPEERSKVDFIPLKRKLANVTEDQWLNLPEATDMTRRNRRIRLEEQMNRKTYAAPDSLLDSNSVDLVKLTEEREKLLARQLDTDFFAKNETNDQEMKTLKYIADIDKDSVNIVRRGDDEEVQKQRLVLKSYRRAEPKDPTSWIASAKLEENCGNYELARELIQQGCLQCPLDETIWLENLRLNVSNNEKKKIIVANAIRFQPKSVALWLEGIKYEEQPANKFRVIQKALREIPAEEEIWKLAVKYNPNDYDNLRICKKALEFIPTSFYFWAILMKEPYEDVMNTLEKVITQNPKQIDLKVYKLMNEEIHKKIDSVSQCKSVIIKELGINMKDMDKSVVTKWLDKVEIWNKSIAVDITTASLCEVIFDSIGEKIVKEYGLDYLDNISNVKIQIIFLKSYLKFEPTKISVWQKLKNICVKSYNIDKFFQVFEELLFDRGTQNSYEMVKIHPNLVLLYVKELWKHDGNPDKALEILSKTLNEIPNFIEGWLAKIKVLLQTGRLDCVASIFDKLLNSLETANYDDHNKERLLYRHVSFLRFMDENEKAVSYIENKYLLLFPQSVKLKLQLVQIYEDMGMNSICSRLYDDYTKRLQSHAVFWIEYANFIQRTSGNTSRARSILDKGIVHNPSNVSLIVAKVRLEETVGNFAQEELLISQGLQTFAKDAELWACRMRLSKSKKSSLKKTLFQDALKATNNSYLILFEVGRSFYHDNQYKVAMKWFDRAVTKQPRFGDGWAYIYNCKQKLNDDLDKLLEKVAELDPAYGEEWIKVSKNVKMQYLSSPVILKKVAERCK